MYANSPTKSLQNPLLKMLASIQDNFPSTPGKVNFFSLPCSGSFVCSEEKEATGKQRKLDQSG
jgi:hypothetical protein